MKFYPLGSIIRMNGHKVCIIGFGCADREGKSVYGYYAAPYPVGFTEAGSILFVPHYADFEVVAAGYRTAASEAALDAFARGAERLAEVPDEELEKLNAAFERLASEKKEADKA